MNEAPQYLTLSEVAKRLESGGKRPSTVSVWRWCRKGCRGTRLEYARFGREIRVTPEALVEFGRAMAANDRDLDAPTSPATVQTPPQSDKRRAAEIAAAKASLKAAGVAI